MSGQPGYPPMIDLPHDCYLPTAKGRRAGIVHVCDMCGQGWVCNRRQPTNIAPTGLSWWWHRWPFEGRQS